MSTLKHSEPLTEGFTLELHGDCLKARICKAGEFLCGLSISLRYYYDSNKGFVTRKTRSQNDCLLLARKWAITHLDRLLEN